MIDVKSKTKRRIKRQKENKQYNGSLQFTALLTLEDVSPSYLRQCRAGEGPVNMDRDVT